MRRKNEKSLEEELHKHHPLIIPTQTHPLEVTNATFLPPNWEANLHCPQQKQDAATLRLILEFHAAK